MTPFSYKQKGTEEGKVVKYKNSLTILQSPRGTLQIIEESGY